MLYQYLMKQHIGSPSVPVVKAGEEVKRGQLLGKKPAEALGANVFSSVSGVVTEVQEDRVMVEEKGTDFSTYLPLTESDPIRLVEESGLVGLGGAGFPTYVKLKTKFPEGKGVVLVNAAECEPILSHNLKRIEKDPEGLVKSLILAMELVKAVKGIIAIKYHHKEAIALLEKEIAKYPGKELSVYQLENIYPVGEERAIVRDALGILLEPEQLPSAADAIVLNAETLYRMKEAIEEKKPLIDKDITVAGKLQEDAAIKVFLDEPLGQSVEFLIQKAGGIGERYGEIIMGGPFTGHSCTMEDPMVKTSGGIIVAEEFFPGPEKIGLLVCACGANRERLIEQSEKMGSQYVGVEYCKQAKEVKGTRKCENPGHCPGQVQKVMALKKAGAQAVLVSNCTDCTNTVMSCAPQLGLPVYHCTDGALRSVNYKMIRRFKESE